MRRRLIRAQNLAGPCPLVTTDDEAPTAARMPAEQRLPALLVLDTDGLPHAVIPGSQLIRELVPPMRSKSRCSLPSSTSDAMQRPRSASAASPLRNDPDVPLLAARRRP